jgi:signal peptidase II
MAWHRENFRSPAALARFYLVTVIGLALDLAVKTWAFSHLAIAVHTLASGHVIVQSNTMTVIPHLIELETTANQGAVFGIGQGQRWLFVAVSILAIGFLTYLFAAGRREQWGYQILLGMLLAGVLGNLYDRFALGYVRDMIHGLPGVTWPGFVGSIVHVPWASGEVFPWIFNIADSLLCTGVALMILHSMFTGKSTVAKPEIGDQSSYSGADLSK